MNIEDFPLAWRWTGTAHTVLPIDVLKTLIPLCLESAELLSKSVPLAFPDSSSKFDAANTQLDAGDWLRKLRVPAQQITLSWNKSMALSLPWLTFCTYWDEFCYSTSDDVDIFLKDKQRFLRWNHFELFEYDSSTLLTKN